jgi:hypothetical protein
MGIPNKTTVLYKQIRREWELLVTGRVIAIDPSCGSSSSMPAYAIYEQGRLLESSIIRLEPDLPLHKRLYTLRHRLDMISPTDILIYEEIPPVRFYGNGRTSAGSQSSLLKSVGVVLASIKADVAIGMRPSVWKKLTQASYVKSDRADAEEMGRIAIEIATHIGIHDRPRERRSLK